MLTQKNNYVIAQSFYYILLSLLEEEFCPHMNVYVGLIWNAYLPRMPYQPAFFQTSVELNVYVGQIWNGGTLFPITLLHTTIQWILFHSLENTIFGISTDTTSYAYKVSSKHTKIHVERRLNKFRMLGKFPKLLENTSSN